MQDDETPAKTKLRRDLEEALDEKIKLAVDKAIEPLNGKLDEERKERANLSSFFSATLNSGKYHQECAQKCRLHWTTWPPMSQPFDIVYAQAEKHSLELDRTMPVLNCAGELSIDPAVLSKCVNFIRVVCRLVPTESEGHQRYSKTGSCSKIGIP